MTTLCIVLTVLSALGCLVWLSRHIMIWREKKTGFVLTADYAQPVQNAPLISVMVAAKDEEANIEACIRSMLEQDYPNFEMIVCNDRSTDGTAAIVERISREDSRVKLVNITQLPEGWCGKNNAMQTGIAQARGEWICMIDADCKQTSPKTLTASLRYALETKADMLSVLPVLEMKTFWENVVQPVCGGVMMIWFHPDKVNNPAKPNAYANGAFILITKQAYQAAGTHQAVKDKVNEDMHMAALAKQKGQNLRVVRCDGLYTVRMYTSLKQILRGWSRIFFGTFGTLPRLTASLAVMLIMGLVPYASAVIGLTGAAHGASALAAGITGLAAAILQVSVIFRFYRLIGARPGLAWSYPLGCLITIIALCMSIGKLRKGAKVTWRGTSYARPPQAG